jgi:hypothetical protein
MSNVSIMPPMYENHIAKVAWASIICHASLTTSLSLSLPQSCINEALTLVLGIPLHTD